MKRLSELMESQEYTLYCDMDGVLCDFDAQFEKYFKKTPGQVESEKGQTYFWALIHKVGAKFWSGMPWTPNGQALWQEISKYKPALLTAPPKQKGDMTKLDPVTMQGKMEWSGANLTPQPTEIIFRRSKDKQLIARRDVALGLTPILIDDRRSNIEEWEAAGGYALYHPKNGDPTEVIKTLKDLYEPTQERV